MTRARIRATPALAAALVVAWMLARPSRPAAHDIPRDVTIHAFVRVDGQRLHLLVRAPLGAMRDIEFPTRGPGYLDLARADRALRDAATIWLSDSVALYEGERRLPAPQLAAARVSLPSDLSFLSYDAAFAHVRGPRLPDETAVYWNQSLLDVLFEYPIRSEQSQFSIHPAFERLGVRVVTVLRVLLPGGTIRAFEFSGDPGVVRLDPRWHQAALRFVELGFFHILDGVDHLLFLFCLVIPFRRMRPLVLVVTSFTVAHSITLIASAAGAVPRALWFPPFVETLIAMSILYMALENVVLSAGGTDRGSRPAASARGGAHGDSHFAGSSVQRRWIVAFAFGLVHGFGFSFGLRETLQFAGSHLLTSLLSFNIGVELGQLVVLLGLIPALNVAFRFVVGERIGTVILSALVAHTAWHWTAERAERLRQFPWPALDTAVLATVMRWTMMLVAVAGIVWLVFVVLRPRYNPRLISRARTVYSEAERE
jgi:hypothetical protein